MKYNVENGILTLFFVGQLNSANAEDVEKEIDAILQKERFNAIKIDMDSLDYISSAGLRIILKIKKQYDDTSLIKVPHGVYEILEMVGFLNIISVEKK